MKRFKIICNKGATSYGGMSNTIEIFIDAETEQEAREIFTNNRENQIYGRYIKTIEEVETRYNYCKHMIWSEANHDYVCRYGIKSVNFCSINNCQFFEKQD